MNEQQAWEALFQQVSASVDLDEAATLLDGKDEIDADVTLDKTVDDRANGFLTEPLVFVAANASDPRVPQWTRLANALPGAPAAATAPTGSAPSPAPASTTPVPPPAPAMPAGLKTSALLGASSRSTAGSKPVVPRITATPPATATTLPAAAPPPVSSTPPVVAPVTTTVDPATHSSPDTVLDFQYSEDEARRNAEMMRESVAAIGGRTGETLAQRKKRLELERFVREQRLEDTARERDRRRAEEEEARARRLTEEAAVAQVKRLADLELAAQQRRLDAEEAERKRLADEQAAERKRQADEAAEGRKLARKETADARKRQADEEAAERKRQADEATEGRKLARKETADARKRLVDEAAAQRKRLTDEAARLARKAQEEAEAAAAAEALKPKPLLAHSREIPALTKQILAARPYLRWRDRIIQAFQVIRNPVSPERDHKLEELAHLPHLLKLMRESREPLGAWSAVHLGDLKVALENGLDQRRPQFFAALYLTGGDYED